jgi:tetratricopeptide (TPR) repeat protein
MVSGDFGIRARRRLSIVKAATLALTSACLALSSSTRAMADEQPWTLTVIKHANKAAELYNNGNYQQARDEFRTAIGLRPNSAELYEGLLNTSIKSNEWDQIAFASEKLLELEPNRKNELAYDYGQALFNLNRWEEAIPWLKRSLNVVDAPIAVYHPKVHSEDIVPEDKKVAMVPPPPVTPPPPPPPPREKVNTNNYIRSFENAIRSESIVIAKYLGLERGEEIHWNSPPQANYHITKVVKGPPLNPSLPIRYEFHDNVSTSAPSGWKFDEKKEMPEKGSEWILFIEFAVPKKGMFETFQGSYGRQPATDDNLNELYSLIEKYNMGIH